MNNTSSYETNDTQVPEITKQTFCKCCGGIKKVWADKAEISPEVWLKFGIAIDAACIC